MKNQAFQTVILHENLESAEFSNRKGQKPTLHLWIANHMLEMSTKLKFQCVRFRKEALFSLVVLNQFLVCFYRGLFTRCDLYLGILLCYYAEAKEMTYESMNLKGVVYEPKETSFSLHSITLSLFTLSSIEMNRKLVQGSVY